jgi:hypothetical protein
MHVAMHREKHWNKGRRYFNRRVMDARQCVAVSLVNTPFFCTKTWKPEKKKKSLRVEVEICFPIIIFWTFQGKTWTVLLAWSLFFSVLIVFWDYFQDYHVLLNII